MGPLALLSSVLLSMGAFFLRKKSKPVRHSAARSEKTPVQTPSYRGEDRRKKINQMQYKINEILRTNPNQPKRRASDT
jgi:hypothetical protein